MIIIPMAGLSKRFKNAGFELPKYMLNANGKTLFEHSVQSFEKYFNKEKFLFIALDVYDTKNFVLNCCRKMGLSDFQLIILDEPTRGQAETVYLGLKKAIISEYEPLLIFNIDTFRPNYTYPKVFDINNIDGYLETFIGEGQNWSNILPENKMLQTVKFTAEKQAISNYCCSGIYYFKFCGDFYKVFVKHKSINPNDLQGGEYYIAPMYNDLITEGKDIRYTVIDCNDIIFCGTPEEYFSFKVY